jgi:hypothetical protein
VIKSRDFDAVRPDDGNEVVEGKRLACSFRAL